MASVRAGTSAVNSQSTPPGSSDPASQRPSGPEGTQPRTIAEMSGPPPLERRPPRPAGAPEGTPSNAAARPRIAAGLPPQPSLGSRRPAPGPGPASKVSPGLDRLPPMPAKPGAPTPTVNAGSPSVIAGNGKSDGRSTTASPGAAERADLPVPDRARSAKLAAGAETTDDASGPPEGAVAALSAALEQKRITPRSPRAALEPDHVPVPSRSPRPSRRARNPLVIVGNAIFTLLILVLIAGGGAFAVGKSRFEAPGPLQEDKVVNIPPRSGMMDIADLLRREGVIDEHRLIFIGGVLALGAHRAQVRRVSVPRAGERARRGGDDGRGQGGAASDHHPGRPDLRADRRAPARQRPPHRQHQGRAARRQPAAGELSHQPRIHARAGDPAHAAGAGAAGARGVGAPQSGSAAEDARAARHPRLDHREGDRQAGGAHARRRRLRQPAEAEDASCNRTRPSSTAWSAARARSAIRSARARSSRRRPTTPT